MDTLTIKAFKTHCQLGVYEWETKIKQPILIDVCLYFDKKPSSDQLDHVHNYAEITLFLDQYCRETPCKLLETLTHLIADQLFSRFPCNQLEVCISKPYAILNSQAISFSTSRPHPN